jgi:4-amino-4-deoxy-L-arabinose transferase-like glycosyltransferase
LLNPAVATSAIGNHKMGGRKVWIASAVLLLLALGFRLFVALRLPNDTPDDGRVYAQIALNVLEQHVYSHETTAPYVPSLIRLPGYPLFLAGVYAVSGHGNNTAVRVIQALLDTGTCALIALVTFQWVDDEKWKRPAVIAALTLAAACPFTTIYVATILTEVPTSFLAVAMVLAATFAFKATSKRRALVWWIITGLLAGTAVLFRPDSGLFAAAIGATIIGSALLQRDTFVQKMSQAVISASFFSLAFCLVLVPWTIRNRLVFHLFQPLSPAHGEMPGEFVPRGYLLWLRTWLDDGRYIGPVLWSLDTRRISIDDFPDSAFTSDEERERVAALLQKYNHPDDQADTEAAGSQVPDTSSSEPQPDEGEEDETANAAQPEDQVDMNVEMTPQIDAGFAELGRERKARAPVRYYLVLPLKRAKSLWFDTHSQYWPFDGELLPLEDLDYQSHQQYWLPLFAGLTWAYTIVGLVGAWLLLRLRETNARRWVILALLITFVRIGFFSTLENPEPRYVVEVFPFLSILGGIAVGCIAVKIREKVARTTEAMSDML